MTKEVLKKIFNWKIISITIITLSFIYLIILIISGGYKECQNWQCFNERMADCRPTHFIGESKSMVFEYTILKKQGANCQIKVKLIQGALNNQQSKKIEGKEMTCNVPLGAVQIPGSDITLCHGLLKEELQDLLIQKLNNYIAQNLGKINFELLTKNNSWHQK